MALNDVSGSRNTMTLVLTGLDFEAKAARAEGLQFATLGGRERFADVDVWLLRRDQVEPAGVARARAWLAGVVREKHGYSDVFRAQPVVPAGLR